MKQESKGFPTFEQMYKRKIKEFEIRKNKLKEEEVKTERKPYTKNPMKPKTYYQEKAAERRIIMNKMMKDFDEGENYTNIRLQLRYAKLSQPEKREVIAYLNSKEKIYEK